MVRKPILYKLLIGVFASVILSGCVAYGESYYYPEPAGPAHVPKGHLPPPGQCRIWFPDRPPGHQPPPGDCYDLERSIPPGATLIYG